VEGDGAQARLLAAVAPGAEPRLCGRPARREGMAAVVGEEPAPEELLKPEGLRGRVGAQPFGAEELDKPSIACLAKRATTAGAGDVHRLWRVPIGVRLDEAPPVPEAEVESFLSRDAVLGGRALVIAEGDGPGGRLRALEFSLGRLDRLAKAAESGVPAVGLGPDGRELRHDRVGGGLAALSLLSLHLRGLGEALDLVGPHGRQHEGGVAHPVGVGQCREPASEMAGGAAVGLPKRVATAQPIVGQDLGREVRAQVARGLPVGHRRQAQRREEAPEAGVHLLDAIADRRHVTAPRRQHGGAQG